MLFVCCCCFQTTCVYEAFETYLEELKTRREIDVIRGPVLRTGLQFEDPLASDDNDLPEDNPLVVLMEFCRLQNLRLVDMFNVLDTDGSKSVSFAEFKEGLKARITAMSRSFAYCCFCFSILIPFVLHVSPRREAGNVWCFPRPPVWKLRAVI